MDDKRWRQAHRDVTGTGIVSVAHEVTLDSFRALGIEYSTRQFRDNQADKPRRQDGRDTTNLSPPEASLPRS